MTQYLLKLKLKSDTTFGRGDGIAGLINREVEHDRYGMPFLRGRTLKGLLCEEADNVIFSLEQCKQDTVVWRNAHYALFGKPGSKDEQGVLHFGRCQLPSAVRQTVINSIAKQQVNSDDILASLTAIRRQTAVDTSGVPDTGSLRSMRVIIRETPFMAVLDSKRDLSNEEKALLAAAVKAFRRAGTGRNRGRGRLHNLDIVADDQSQLASWFGLFTTLGGLTDAKN